MANSVSGESMISRVIRIFETFSEDQTTQTPSQIGHRANIPSSSAHRIIGELVEAGLLETDEEHRIRLGMRLWELAMRGSTALRLRQVALPRMEEIQQLLREHTQIAVLEHEEALFLERLSHPEAGANITRIAGRLPLHASSSGLILLAHADPELRERVLSGQLRRLAPGTITSPTVLRRTLSEIRRNGFIVARESIEAVSTGVAVPIRQEGVVIAALSVVLPVTTPVEPAIKSLTVARNSIEAELSRFQK